MVVAFLHPGEMGASLAAACRQPGLWLEPGRSTATRARAAAAGLEAVGTLAALVERADVVVSVCPPAAALDVAQRVADAGFDGIYADLNATSPDTARAIGTRFEHFVDGGVVGPPVRAAGATRMYLAGQRAAEVAQLWAGSALDVRIMTAGVGAASALKGCYAGWTKISAALLLAVRAAAAAEGVSDELVDEWSLSLPELARTSERTASSNAPKAWRFVGEMEQIASMFVSNGLPDGFAGAAADVYQRMARLKDVSAPAIADVIDALREPSALERQ